MENQNKIKKIISKNKKLEEREHIHRSSESLLAAPIQEASSTVLKPKKSFWKLLSGIFRNKSAKKKTGVVQEANNGQAVQGVSSQSETEKAKVDIAQADDGSSTEEDRPKEVQEVRMEKEHASEPVVVPLSEVSAGSGHEADDEAEDDHDDHLRRLKNALDQMRNEEQKIEAAKTNVQFNNKNEKVKNISSETNSNESYSFKYSDTSSAATQESTRIDKVDIKSKIMPVNGESTESDDNTKSIKRNKLNRKKNKKNTDNDIVQDGCSKISPDNHTMCVNPTRNQASVNYPQIPKKLFRGKQKLIQEIEDDDITNGEIKELEELSKYKLIVNEKYGRREWIERINKERIEKTKNDKRKNSFGSKLFKLPEDDDDDIESDKKKCKKNPLDLSNIEAGWKKAEEILKALELQKNDNPSPSPSPQLTTSQIDLMFKQMEDNLRERQRLKHVRKTAVEVVKQIENEYTSRTEKSLLEARCAEMLTEYEQDFDCLHRTPGSTTLENDYTETNFNPNPSISTHEKNLNEIVPPQFDQSCESSCIASTLSKIETESKNSVIQTFKGTEQLETSDLNPEFLARSKIENEAQGCSEDETENLRLSRSEAQELRRFRNEDDELRTSRIENEHRKRPISVDEELKTRPTSADESGEDEELRRFRNEYDAMKTSVSEDESNRRPVSEEEGLKTSESEDEGIKTEEEDHKNEDKDLKNKDKILKNEDECHKNEDESLGSEDETLKNEDEGLNSEDDDLKTPGNEDEVLETSRSRDEGLRTEDEDLRRTTSEDEGLESGRNEDEGLETDRNEDEGVKTYESREERLENEDEGLESDEEYLESEDNCLRNEDKYLRNEERLKNDDEGLQSDLKNEEEACKNEDEWFESEDEDPKPRASEDEGMKSIDKHPSRYSNEYHPFRMSENDVKNNIEETKRAKEKQRRPSQKDRTPKVTHFATKTRKNIVLKEKNSKKSLDKSEVMKSSLPKNNVIASDLEDDSESSHIKDLVASHLKQYTNSYNHEENSQISSNFTDQNLKSKNESCNQNNESWVCLQYDEDQTKKVSKREAMKNAQNEAMNAQNEKIWSSEEVWKKFEDDEASESDNEDKLHVYNKNETDDDEMYENGNVSSDRPRLSSPVFISSNEAPISGDKRSLYKYEAYTPSKIPMYTDEPTSSSCDALGFSNEALTSSNEALDITNETSTFTNEASASTNEASAVVLSSNVLSNNVVVSPDDVCDVTNDVVSSPNVLHRGYVEMSTYNVPVFSYDAIKSSCDVKKPDVVNDMDDVKDLNDATNASDEMNDAQDDLRKISDDVVKKSDDVVKKSDEILKKSDEIVKKTSEIVRKTDDVVNLNDVEYKTDDVKNNSDRVMKNSDDVMKDSDDVDKKPHEILEKTEDITKKKDDVVKNTNEIKDSEDMVENPEDVVKNKEDVVKNTDDVVKNPDDVVNKSEDVKISEDVLKNFVDKLKNPEDVVENSEDVLEKMKNSEHEENSEDVFRSSEDVVKSYNDILKSSEDVVKNSNDVLKSSDDVLKNYQEILKNSNDVVNNLGNVTNDVVSSPDDVLKNEIPKRSDEEMRNSNEILQSSDEVFLSSYNMCSDVDDVFENSDNVIRSIDEAFKAFNLKDQQRCEQERNNVEPKSKHVKEAFDKIKETEDALNKEIDELVHKLTTHKRSETSTFYFGNPTPPALPTMITPDPVAKPVYNAEYNISISPAQSKLLKAKQSSENEDLFEMEITDLSLPGSPTHSKTIKVHKLQKDGIEEPSVCVIDCIEFPTAKNDENEDEKKLTGSVLSCTICEKTKRYGYETVTNEDGLLLTFKKLPSFVIHNRDVGMICSVPTNTPSVRSQTSFMKYATTGDISNLTYSPRPLDYEICDQTFDLLTQVRSKLEKFLTCLDRKPEIKRNKKHKKKYSKRKFPTLLTRHSRHSLSKYDFVNPALALNFVDNYKQVVTFAFGEDKKRSHLSSILCERNNHYQNKKQTKPPEINRTPTNDTELPNNPETDQEPPKTTKKPSITDRKSLKTEKSSKVSMKDRKSSRVSIKENESKELIPQYTSDPSVDSFDVPNPIKLPKSFTEISDSFRPVSKLARDSLEVFGKGHNRKNIDLQEVSRILRDLCGKGKNVPKIFGKNAVQNSNRKRLDTSRVTLEPSRKESTRKISVKKNPDEMKAYLEHSSIHGKYLETSRKGRDERELSRDDDRASRRSTDDDEASRTSGDTDQASRRSTDYKKDEFNYGASIQIGNDNETSIIIDHEASRIIGNDYEASRIDDEYGVSIKTDKETSGRVEDANESSRKAEVNNKTSRTGEEVMDEPEVVRKDSGLSRRSTDLNIPSRKDSKSSKRSGKLPKASKKSSKSSRRDVKDWDLLCASKNSLNLLEDFGWNSELASEMEAAVEDAEFVEEAIKSTDLSGMEDRKLEKETSVMDTSVCGVEIDGIVGDLMKEMDELKCMCIAFDVDKSKERGSVVLDIMEDVFQKVDDRKEVFLVENDEKYLEELRCRKEEEVKDEIRWISELMEQVLDKALNDSDTSNEMKIIYENILEDVFNTVDQDDNPVINIMTYNSEDSWVKKQSLKKYLSNAIEFMKSLNEEICNYDHVSRIENVPDDNEYNNQSEVYVFNLRGGFDDAGLTGIDDDRRVDDDIRTTSDDNRRTDEESRRTDGESRRTDGESRRTDVDSRTRDDEKREDTRKGDEDPGRSDDDSEDESHKSVDQVNNSDIKRLISNRESNKSLLMNRRQIYYINRNKSEVDMSDDSDEADEKPDFWDKRRMSERKKAEEKRLKMEKKQRKSEEKRRKSEEKRRKSEEKRRKSEEKRRLSEEKRKQSKDKNKKKEQPEVPTDQPGSSKDVKQELYALTVELDDVNRMNLGMLDVEQKITQELSEIRTELSEIRQNNELQELSEESRKIFDGSPGLLHLDESRKSIVSELSDDSNDLPDKSEVSRITSEFSRMTSEFSRMTSEVSRKVSFKSGVETEIFDDFDETSEATRTLTGTFRDDSRRVSFKSDAISEDSRGVFDESRELSMYSRMLTDELRRVSYTSRDLSVYSNETTARSRALTEEFRVSVEYKVEEPRGIFEGVRCGFTDFRDYFRGLLNFDRSTEPVIPETSRTDTDGVVPFVLEELVEKHESKSIMSESVQTSVEYCESISEEDEEDGDVKDFIEKLITIGEITRDIHNMITKTEENHGVPEDETDDERVVTKEFLVKNQTDPMMVALDLKLDEELRKIDTDLQKINEIKTDMITGKNQIRQIKNRLNPQEPDEILTNFTIIKDPNATELDRIVDVKIIHKLNDIIDELSSIKQLISDNPELIDNILDQSDQDIKENLQKINDDLFDIYENQNDDPANTETSSFASKRTSIGTDPIDNLIGIKEHTIKLIQNRLKMNQPEMYEDIRMEMEGICNDISVITEQVDDKLRLYNKDDINDSYETINKPEEVQNESILEPIVESPVESVLNELKIVESESRSRVSSEVLYIEPTTISYESSRTSHESGMNIEPKISIESSPVIYVDDIKRESKLTFAESVKNEAINDETSMVDEKSDETRESLIKINDSLMKIVDPPHETHESLAKPKESPMKIKVSIEKIDNSSNKICESLEKIDELLIKMETDESYDKTEALVKIHESTTDDGKLEPLGKIDESLESSEIVYDPAALSRLVKERLQELIKEFRMINNKIPLITNAIHAIHDETPIHIESTEKKEKAFDTNDESGLVNDETSMKIDESRPIDEAKSINNETLHVNDDSCHEARHVNDEVLPENNVEGLKNNESPATQDETPPINDEPSTTHDVSPLIQNETPPTNDEPSTTHDESPLTQDETHPINDEPSTTHDESHQSQDDLNKNLPDLPSISEESLKNDESYKRSQELKKKLSRLNTFSRKINENIRNIIKNTKCFHKSKGKISKSEDDLKTDLQESEESKGFPRRSYDDTRRDTQEISDDFRRLVDEKRGINEEKREINEDTRGIDEGTREINEDTRGIDEDTRGNDDESRRVIDDTQKMDDDTQRIGDDARKIDNDTRENEDVIQKLEDDTKIDVDLQKINDAFEWIKNNILEMSERRELCFDLSEMEKYKTELPSNETVEEQDKSVGTSRILPVREVSGKVALLEKDEHIGTIKNICLQNITKEFNLIQNECKTIHKECSLLMEECIQRKNGDDSEDSPKTVMHLSASDFRVYSTNVDKPYCSIQNLSITSSENCQYIPNILQTLYEYSARIKIYSPQIPKSNQLLISNSELLVSPDEITKKTIDDTSPSTSKQSVQHKSTFQTDSESDIKRNESKVLETIKSSCFVDVQKSSHEFLLPEKPKSYHQIDDITSSCLIAQSTHVQINSESHKYSECLANQPERNENVSKDFPPEPNSENSPKLPENIPVDNQIFKDLELRSNSENSPNIPVEGNENMSNYCDLHVGYVSDEDVGVQVDSPPKNEEKMLMGSFIEAIGKVVEECGSIWKDIKSITDNMDLIDEDKKRILMDETNSLISERKIIETIGSIVGSRKKLEDEITMTSEETINILGKKYNMNEKISLSEKKNLKSDEKITSETSTLISKDGNLQSVDRNVQSEDEKIISGKVQTSEEKNLVSENENEVPRDENTVPNNENVVSDNKNIISESKFNETECDCHCEIKEPELVLSETEKVSNKPAEKKSKLKKYVYKGPVTPTNKSDKKISKYLDDSKTKLKPESKLKSIVQRFIRRRKKPEISVVISKESSDLIPDTKYINKVDNLDCNEECLVFESMKTPTTSAIKLEQLMENMNMACSSWFDTNYIGELCQQELEKKICPRIMEKTIPCLSNLKGADSRLDDDSRILKENVEDVMIFEKLKIDIKNNCEKLRSRTMTKFCFGNNTNVTKLNEKITYTFGNKRDD